MPHTQLRLALVIEGRLPGGMDERRAAWEGARPRRPAMILGRSACTASATARTPLAPHHDDQLIARHLLRLEHRKIQLHPDRSPVTDTPTSPPVTSPCSPTGHERG